MKITDRKIVIINQAVNYLTIGICNEFADKFEQVSLITGSVHTQGEELNANIKIEYITKWREKHGLNKVIIYLKALISMYFLLILKYRKHEVFFISVPPMGYLLNLVLPHRFSMIIWDVYPDGLKITGMKESHLVYRCWSKLNQFSFKKAYKLFTIGEKITELLIQYAHRDKIIVTPIWSIFQENRSINRMYNPFIEKHRLKDKFVVQYSGNIGVTHNVETLVFVAEKMQKYSNIIFQIIGRGPRVNVLKNLVKQKGLSNCQFLPFQSDEMFPFSLSAADLGVVILDDLTSKGSVPSKSYNLMSFGIPSLYIAARDSELFSYSLKYKHAECFGKDEYDNIINYILNLSNNNNLYNLYSLNALEAAKNFKRDNAKKLVDKYLQ